MHANTLLALAGPSSGQEPNPMASFVLMGIIFAIFYFILILPMKKKQKKLESVVKSLKSGDKVIINPGILGTVEGVDEETLNVRIAEKTRIKVLRSAVAGLQDSPNREKK
jgi:preprotein translocase subunit YajC